MAGVEDDAGLPARYDFVFSRSARFHAGEADAKAELKRILCESLGLVFEPITVERDVRVFVPGASNRLVDIERLADDDVTRKSMVLLRDDLLRRWETKFGEPAAYDGPPQLAVDLFELGDRWYTEIAADDLLLWLRNQGLDSKVERRPVTLIRVARE